METYVTVSMQYILMFCMHQKHIYHSCYEYYIHFNIQIHIELMSHYDMYQIILYTMHINYVTFTSHISITLWFMFISLSHIICVQIYLSVKQGQGGQKRKRVY